MLKITPTEEPKIVQLRCPDCNRKICNVGLLKDKSQIEGLVIICRDCQKIYTVTTTIE